jgi:hypothetical protein
MGRPRCDPFDAAAIIEAISTGETTPRRLIRITPRQPPGHTHGQHLRLICADMNGLAL